MIVRSYSCSLADTGTEALLLISCAPLNDSLLFILVFLRYIFCSVAGVLIVGSSS